MDQSATYESKRVHIDNLFRMVQCCENVADCRRAQLLNYFGERDFNREECDSFKGAICDNCVSKVRLICFIYSTPQEAQVEEPLMPFLIKLLLNLIL